RRGPRRTLPRGGGPRRAAVSHDGGAIEHSGREGPGGRPHGDDSAGAASAPRGVPLTARYLGVGRSEKRVRSRCAVGTGKDYPQEFGRRTAFNCQIFDERINDVDLGPRSSSRSTWPRDAVLDRAGAGGGGGVRRRLGLIGLDNPRTARAFPSRPPRSCLVLSPRLSIGRTRKVDADGRGRLATLLAAWQTPARGSNVTAAPA
ncbi:hypothetical protein THAOC_29397, partial [Thalassiosira oceanica]